MTKFIMHGCNGAMGQVITRLAKEDPETEIVAGIDIQDNINNDYPVFTKIEECDVPADVIVDCPSDQMTIRSQHESTHFCENCHIA